MKSKEISVKLFNTDKKNESARTRKKRYDNFKDFDLYDISEQKEYKTFNCEETKYQSDRFKL